MSIWSSVVGEEIRALDGHDYNANMHARGEPTIAVDVATARSWHDHIRLALDDDASIEVCALLSPAAARQLRDRLNIALGD